MSSPRRLDEIAATVVRRRLMGMTALIEFDQPPLPPASPAVALLEQGVLVSVSGRPLLLPEIALSEGLSDLRSATEAHVPMEDYANSVARVLTVLANLGVSVDRAPS